MLTPTSAQFDTLKTRSANYVQQGCQKASPFMTRMLTAIEAHPGLAMVWWSEGKPLHNHDQMYFTFGCTENGVQWLHTFYGQLWAFLDAEYQEAMNTARARGIDHHDYPMLAEALGHDVYLDLSSVRLTLTYKRLPDSSASYPAYTLSMAVRDLHSQYAAHRALLSTLATCPIP